jgi:membrane AbrB-like protein
MTKRSAGSVTTAAFDVRGVAFVIVMVGLGLALSARFRVPAGAILVPMILAAVLSLVDSSLIQPVPLAVGDLAFAAIGLDVGLRFTPAAIREAGAVLPYAIAVIVAMLVVCAGIGVALAEMVHVSMLDAYLATTPGGLSAVLALAVGGKTNATFIISVQVIRTFLMLAAAPSLARWFAARNDSLGTSASTAENRAA